FYIGVNSVQTIALGTPRDFQITLVTPSGELYADDTSLNAAVYAVSWNSTLVYRDGRYHFDSHRLLDEVRGAVNGKVDVQSGRASVQVALSSSGEYVLVTRNPGGAMTSITFYASDGNPWEGTISREDPQKLDVQILGQAAT